jgi:hypothetical protein
MVIFSHEMVFRLPVQRAEGVPYQLSTLDEAKKDVKCRMLVVPRRYCNLPLCTRQKSRQSDRTESDAGPFEGGNNRAPAPHDPVTTQP